MRKIFLFLLLLFLVGFASAEIEFNCPEKVAVNEEFSCNLKVSGLEGVWDAKVELLKGSSNVARVWNEAEEKWKSAFYYLNGFVSSGIEKEIMLKVESPGNFDGTLKLRQTSKKESAVFSIIVEEEKSGSEKNLGGDNLVDENFEKGEIEEDKINDKIGDLKEIPIKINDKSEEPEIIFLNSKVADEGEVIYRSKTQKAIDYAPYIFSIFLIFIIVILFWEKF